jgi:hypothetical protein
MGVFSLKLNDTLPVLEVALLGPDGAAHDLTGSSGWKLHILLSSGEYLTRDMTLEGNEADGVLRYAWVPSDWDAGSGGAGTYDDPYTVGGLIAGPPLPLAQGAREHRMEYEVLGAGGARLTFPNSGTNDASRYDRLRICADLGQGEL